MPNTSNEILRRHVVLIAEQMVEPWKWQLDQIELHDDGLECCVCGTHIKWVFIIRHSDDPKRELKIGSTCIEATVPWLISMNAEALAEAIRTQWALVLEEIRKARQQEQGLRKLKPVLALAVALDEWLFRIIEASQIYWYSLPKYWQEYYLYKGKTLLAAGGNTPAKQAASLARRIANFRDRVPLLREALRKVGKDGSWNEPPTTGDHDVDLWYEAWLTANTLRENLQRSTKRKNLWETCREYYDTASQMKSTRLPASGEKLREWIAAAEAVLALAPSDEQIAEAANRLAHLAKIEKTRRRLAQAEAELAQLLKLPAKRDELLRNGELKWLRLRQQQNEKRRGFEYTARVGNTIYKLSDRLRQPQEKQCVYLIGEQVFDNGHIRIVLVHFAENFENLRERTDQKVAEVTNLKAELAALEN